MDRRIASATALLVALLTFHQRADQRAYGLEAGQSARPPARVPLLSAPAGTTEARPVGAAPTCAMTDCGALVPYRETGPWVASCDRFASPNEASHAVGVPVSLGDTDRDATGRNVASWCLPSDRGTLNIRFLIITLPDPATTHLALYFDRTLESVEAAAQQDGFFLDRYWLPWTPPGGMPAGGDTSHDVRVDGMLDSLRSKEPGVLIFTRTAAAAAGHGGEAGCSSPCMMYAFLVSESPTSGVNKTQFANAVRYARVLGAPRGAPLRVVGPFFSGSVPSVLEVQSDLAADGEHQGKVLSFASGTMSSADQAASLRRLDPAFQQLLHDDSTAMRFLLSFLKRQGLTTRGENVAILQEDETRYGNARASDPTSRSIEPPEDPIGESFRRVRHITFPRELSRLRNAAPDTFGAAPAAPGLSAPIPSQNLSWVWKDTSRDEDRVPAFSGPQEPLSQQAVMLTIADVIRRENIKYVGIVATDVFDMLFLSKFLKMTAPNTRLFLLDADLLMVRTSNEGRELEGTLAVTTYPLFARNADWTSGSDSGPANAEPRTAGFQSSVDVFPSRTAEGIYNAVLLQLNGGEPRPLREYANPLLGTGKNDRPALWLTMVGRTGFWPVAIRDNQDAVTQPAPAFGAPVLLAASVRHRLTFDPPGGAALFLQGILLVWGMIHLLGMHFAARTGIRWLGAVYIGGRKIASPGAQYQTYYLVCGTLALSAMLLLIAISFAWVTWDGRIAFSNGWLFKLFYSAIGLVGAALALSACWASKQGVATKIDRSIAVFPWMLFGAILLLWMYWHAPHLGAGIFFAQRALNMGDGVSPLLPVELLLLMYYLWAWIFIRKVRLSESKQVAVPHLKFLGLGGDVLNQSVVDLKHGTDDLVFNPNMAGSIAMAFVAMFLLLLRPWEALHSVEGLSYDVFVVFLVGFICLLILLTWARYLYIWNRLRQVLRGLERAPLRKAFDRLPKTYSWSLLWYGDAARRWYTISARSVECFQALRNCPEIAGDAANQLFEKMEEAFTRVVESDESEFRTDDRHAAVQDLQNVFVAASELILVKLLKEHWEKPTNPDRPCALLAEEFVALRFVGLIHFESAQLTNLLLLLSVGFVLALASVASYPFLAGMQCVWTLAGVFVLFGAGVIVSFAQMSRDAILSRLSRTDPGKLDWSFYLRVASYGGLPLLALLTSQFPPLGRFLFSWLEPALNALH